MNPQTRISLTQLPTSLLAFFKQLSLSNIVAPLNNLTLSPLLGFAWIYLIVAVGFSFTV